MEKVLVAYFSGKPGKLLNGASKKDIEIWTEVNR